MRTGTLRDADGVAEIERQSGTVDAEAQRVTEVQGRAVGEQEAIVVRRADEGIDAVYVTTLRRTAQTAAPLLARIGLEARVEADLREVSLGEWDGGQYRKHARAGHPLIIQMMQEERWDVIPGAEPMEVFAERVAAGLARIVAAHPDQRVAVFTHGGVIGEAMRLAVGGTRPFAFIGADNGSISHLVAIGDRWIVRRYNDTAHLAPGYDRE